MALADSPNINVRRSRWVGLSRAGYDDLTEPEKEEYTKLEKEFGKSPQIQPQHESGILGAIKGKITEKMEENRRLNAIYKQERAKADIKNIKAKAKADSKARYIRGPETSGGFFGGMGRRGLEVFGGMSFDKKGRIQEPKGGVERFENLSHRSRFEEPNMSERMMQGPPSGHRSMSPEMPEREPPSLEGFNKHFNEKRKIFGF